MIMFFFLKSWSHHHDLFQARTCNHFPSIESHRLNVRDSVGPGWYVCTGTEGARVELESIHLEEDDIGLNLGEERGACTFDSGLNSLSETPGQFLSICWQESLQLGLPYNLQKVASVRTSLVFCWRGCQEAQGNWNVREGLLCTTENSLLIVFPRRPRRAFLSLRL